MKLFKMRTLVALLLALLLVLGACTATPTPTPTQGPENSNEAVGSWTSTSRPAAERLRGDVNDDATVDIDDILAVRRDMFGEVPLAGEDLATALLLTPEGIDIDTILKIRAIIFGTDTADPTQTPASTNSVVVTPTTTPSLETSPTPPEAPVLTAAPFVTTPVLNGTTYYVATTGDNSNPGTKASPWKTLQHAVNTIDPGDTILVAGGTYAGFTVRVAQNGTASGWKCIKAEDPANKPRITSPGPSPQSRPSFVQFYGGGGFVRYWVADGLVTDNRANDIFDKSKNMYGFDSVAASNIIIRNCEAYGHYMTGIFCAVVDNYLAENNISEANGEHGFYFNCGGRNFIFRNNVSKSNTGCGFHLNGGYDLPKSIDNRSGIHRNGLYEYNITTDNGKGNATVGVGGGASFNLSSLWGGIVRNNLSFNEHGGGMTFYGGNASDVSRDIEIYNNTFVLAEDSTRFIINFDGNNIGHMCENHPADANGMGLPPYNDLDRRGEPLNLYFFNNIFASMAPVKRLVVDTENAHPGNPAGGSVPTGPRLQNPNVIFRGNLFNSAGSNLGFMNVPKSVTGIAATDNVFENNLSLIFVDPTAGGDFHLKPGSPAIGCGMPFSTGLTDNGGTMRPSDNKDAGAFVFGG